MPLCTLGWHRTLAALQASQALLTFGRAGLTPSAAAAAAGWASIEAVLWSEEMRRARGER
jgi:hypothetical protein